MKIFKHYFAGIAICALLFSSCSKEDQTPGDSPDPEMAILSFGAILNDFNETRSMSKQSLEDFPECFDDEASYVRIILSQDGSPVVGSQTNPFRVDLVANQIFTEEVSELELTPGIYSLDYFAVYSADGKLIWLAPNGGMMTEYFDDPLPLSIDLRAGVKKYMEVSVLCFDNRLVNEYGYLFFELDATQAIEFCIFGNYCDPTGRHYPAEFSVSVWNYANGTMGTELYSGVSNTVELDENGDYAATTVCLALPDTDGVNEYYIEITLLNSDAYGNVVEEVIRSGVINDSDIRELFDGEDNVDYYHFREGNCNMEDSPDWFGDTEPSNTYFGPAVEIGGGTAQTLVRLSDSGNLQAVGLKFSADVLNALPDDFEHYTLQFPEEAGDMIFDHFDMEWNPNGHEPPGIYDLPHFDFHFYMISEAEKMMITDAGLAEILPAPELIPETYVPTPGFVPMMGKHWVSTAAGELNGEVFDQTFIYGSYDGEFLFYEPMITLDYLQNNPNEEFEIFQPESFQKSGFYPTAYSIRYDAANDEYLIMLEGMVQR